MCDMYCPLCYSNRRGRSNFAGHRWSRPSRRVVYSFGVPYVKRPTDVDPESPMSRPLTDPAFAKRCPTLFEYLTCDRWDDDRPRETSTFTVCVDEGMVKVCINDRALRRSAWVSGVSFQNALDAAEAFLAEGKAGWRRWKDDDQKKRKKN